MLASAAGKAKQAAAAATLPLAGCKWGKEAHATPIVELKTHVILDSSGGGDACRFIHNFCITNDHDDNIFLVDTDFFFYFFVVVVVA